MEKILDYLWWFAYYLLRFAINFIIGMTVFTLTGNVYLALIAELIYCLTPRN